MCNALNHSPGCNCGWGAGQGVVQSVEKSPVGSCKPQNFCRSTTCQHCGAEVFFVRHNNGSIWFDALGKPWPKHSCYIDQEVGSVEHWLNCLVNPLFGVVIKVPNNGESNIVRVECSDNIIREMDIVVERASMLRPFLGDFVVFAISTKEFIRPFVSSTVYRITQSKNLGVKEELPEVITERRTFLCAKCGKSFNSNSALNLHLQSQHRYAPYSASR